MPARLVPERLHPRTAPRVGDRVGDGAVAEQGTGVGEQRVRPVEQPQLALLVDRHVVDEHDARALPVRTARPELPGHDPLGERFGGDGGLVVHAGQGLDRRDDLVGRGRGDPVDHRGGELHVRADPVRQRRVDEPGQPRHDGPGDAPVVGEVVAGQDGDRPGTRGAAGGQARDEAAGNGGDGGGRVGAQRGDVGGDLGAVLVEPAVRAEQVRGLRHGERDDGDLVAAQQVEELACSVEACARVIEVTTSGGRRRPADQQRVEAVLPVQPLGRVGTAPP